jgi:putative ABC transport system permease protein
MATAVVRKSWTDLSRRPARTVLTALTVALAVASFGILALPSLMNLAMRSEVANARMYDLAIPIDDVRLTPAQLANLAKLPNVTDVTARSEFATRALIGDRRVDAEVWGVTDFDRQPIDRVTTAGRPGAGEVLVDVQDARRGIWAAKTGTMFRLQAANGSLTTFRVAGSGRSMALDQGTATNHLVLYATQATVQTLGRLSGVNYLELKLRDARRPAAQTTATRIRAFLASQPHPSQFSDLPVIRTPGDWPGKSIFTQRSEILVILTVLAVLSAALLLANTIRTMIVEQEREIGVMRAVGASRRDLRHAYLRTAIALGALGAILGAPLGVALAYLLTEAFAGLIWGVSPGFAIDWPVAIASAAAGIVGVVAVTWLTLHRALRTSVLDALEGQGTSASFGNSALDRAIVHTGRLPSSVRIGVRNIARHKDRSTTTIIQIALAAATLLGLLSLALAVQRTTDASWNVLAYDITLTIQAGGHTYTPTIVNTIRAQPGVAGVEPAYLSQMGYRGQTLYAWGLHRKSFVHEPLATGRWLSTRDEATSASVIVVGSAAARLWHLRPGDHITLNAAGGATPFTVIGIGRSLADNGFNIYTTVGALQTAARHPGDINALLIRAAGTRHGTIDRLAAHLEDTLTHAGYTSRLQVMYAGRANDKASARTMLVIVELIGLLIVAISMIGLVNTITMNILSRTREIGVLRSLGAPARDLRRIFRAETVTLAIIGYALAVPLGWIVAHSLQWLILHLANGRLPAPYTLKNLTFAFIGTLALAILVVAAPLRRATKLQPGDAIRYD